jgi:hypothetical protein
MIGDRYHRNLSDAVRPRMDGTAVLLDLRSWDEHEQDVTSHAAAISVGDRHLLIHHHRYSPDHPNVFALLACMTRLLTDAGLDIPDELRDEAYEHLATHYLELGIEPPEPGSMDEDRAYELAVEGRLAHIDDEGQAWIFAEPAEDEGCVVPGFVSVDGRALKLCMAPTWQPMDDPEYWGNPVRAVKAAERLAHQIRA